MNTFTEKEIEELYKLPCDKLLEKARECGVNFPQNYNLPYSKRGYLRQTYYEANVRNFDQLKEVHVANGEPEGARYEIYTIMCQDSPWYDIFGAGYAKEHVSMLNKRHIIVAMQSENPAFPVLI